MDESFRLPDYNNNTGTTREPEPDKTQEYLAL